MKLKSFLLGILAVVLVVSLCACNNSDNNTKTTTQQTTVENVEKITGEIIDAGNIKALCPTGWLNSPVQDIWAEEEDALDSNALYFLKGAESELDIFSCPSVRIDYYGPDNELTDISSFYTDVQKFSFEVDGVQWEGFTGKSGSYLNGILNIKDSGEIQVSVYLEAEKGKITFDDADFKAILASIEY